MSNTGRAVAGSDGYEGAVRLGLYGKGVLYAVIGVLAANVAFRGGGDGASQRGAIDAVAEQPFGTVLLGALAVGLSAYALWRLAQVFIGPVGSSSLPEWLQRITYLVRAVTYGALAALAWRVVFGGSSGPGGGGSSEQEWTARLLELPFGVPLVVAIGVVVCATGLYQFRTAWKRDFLDGARTGSMSNPRRRLFERAGVAGHAARGVVYLLVGGFLVRAALTFDPDEGVGLGEALAELAEAPYGTAMLLVVAVGLFLYGGFSIVLGRYAQAQRMS